MRVTQKVFEGLGTVNVPHKNTINGIGSANILAEATCVQKIDTLVEICKIKRQKQTYHIDEHKHIANEISVRDQRKPQS